MSCPMGEITRVQDRLVDAIQNEGINGDAVAEALADYYRVVRRDIISDIADDLERIQRAVTESQSEMGHVVLGWVRDVLYANDSDAD